MNYLKKINIKNIPLGVDVELRLDINRIDLDFYEGGEYLQIATDFYVVKKK